MTAAKKVKTRTQDKIKVLIADDDGPSTRRTRDFLAQNGFDVRTCANGQEAKTLLVGWRPKVLLVDLLLPEVNAYGLLRYVQNEPAVRGLQMAVIVMSSHNAGDNVRESYQRGAKDYIARPIHLNDLLNRVVFHCRDAREVDVQVVDASAAPDTLKLADVVVTQALQKLSLEETLFQFTQMATIKLKGLRCSIVFSVTHERGIVLASNDKRDIAGLNLDLRKYPELQLVMNTGKMVVIDNVNESKALSRIKSQVKDIQFNSMLVSPLYYHHKPFGVISLRLPEDRRSFSDKDLRFMEFLAKVISLYISTQGPDTIGKYAPVGVPASS